MIRAPRPFTLVLIAANAMAAALTLWPFLPRTTHAAAPFVASAGNAAPLPVRLAAFGNYAATVERPLFSPSRRPPAGEAASTLGSAGRYRLEGLIITNAARHALLAEVTSGRTLIVGEGQVVGGWTVKRIAPDGVVMASPAGETTLSLDPAAKP